MAYEPPDEIGESHPRISDAKAYMGKMYAYAKLEGLGTTDTSDEITPGFERAFRQYRINKHYDFIKGRLPAGMPDLDPANPDFNWAAQKNMYLLAPTTTPPPPVGIPPYYGLSWTGTWGAWDNGYGYHTLRRAKERNPDKLDFQGLGYDTTAFMMGNPTHSYLDMVRDGVNEGRRFALPERRRKILAGYSGGAGAVVQFLHEWPADRRGEIAIILQFGDPNRPPGPTLLGNDPGGHGISEDFPPEWCLDRYYSFALPGDMYPCAEGLLPIFYDILVRMEASMEFVGYLFSLLVGQTGLLTSFGKLALGVGSSMIPGFGMLASLIPLITGLAGGGLGGLIGGGLMGGTSNIGGLLGGAPTTSKETVGGQPINLIAMLMNIPAIIVTLKALLDFVISGDHGKYHITPAFDGMPAEDKAIQLILDLP